MRDEDTSHVMRMKNDLSKVLQYLKQCPNAVDLLLIKERCDNAGTDIVTSLSQQKKSNRLFPSELKKNHTRNVLTCSMLIRCTFF